MPKRSAKQKDPKAREWEIRGNTLFVTTWDKKHGKRIWTYVGPRFMDFLAQVKIVEECPHGYAFGNHPGLWEAVA